MNPYKNLILLLLSIVGAMCFMLGAHLPNEESLLRIFIFLVGSMSYPAYAHVASEIDD